MVYKARSISKKARVISFLIIVMFCILFFPYHNVFLFWPAIDEFSSLELSSFKVSFYAGLYSGALYSIFTGLIVSGIFFSLQKSFEKNQLREQALIDIAATQEQLKFILAQPQVVQLQEPVFYYPAMKELLEFISKQPISLWEKRVKDSEELSFISSYQKCFLEFLTQARIFDSYLKRFITVYVSQNSINYGEFNNVYQYFHGRTINVRPEDILNAIGLSTTVTWFEDLYIEASKLSAFIKETNDYLKAKYEHENAFQDLKKNIGVSKH